jgi:choline dehydrogenase-like flavoprotein
VSDDRHYDVIIIGTGAGGGTLAHRLAPSGKRVLLLERGNYLPRERDNWDSTAVFVRGKYRAPEFWYDRNGDEFPPEVNYYVGGNTKFYGAALFRLRPEDFGELRHHGGISPAWPIGYAELEPYYSMAEHLYLVHGRHGEDPTAGPTSADYRYTPVQHEPRIQQLSDDLEKQGLHPFHLPIGVRLTQDERGRPTHGSVCIRCDRVDGFPCLVGGKADAQVICVDPALRYENVQLLTDAHATRLETDPGGGTVTAVVTEVGNGDGGVETVRFHADVVVVACGAVNSAALLLASANDRHPDGLANGSGVVGRHYMRHNNLALMAVSKEPNPTRFQKTLALHDWYLGSDDWDYPLGGIQMLGKSDAEQIRANAPHWAGHLSPEMPFESSPITPSTSGSAARTSPTPTTASPSTGTAASTLRSTPRTTSRGSSGSATNCRADLGTWACTRSTSCTTASTCTRACPSAQPRTRPAPCASAPTHGARHSTRTARRTNSTTSTSSTPASSRASAP